MIKPGEIQQIANKLGIRDTQIEKDYVIGWVLKGISENEYLKSKLVFKGGTALRKIFFPDYRLSEDLDFTYYGENFSPGNIKNQFMELIIWLKDEARIAMNFQYGEVHQTGTYNFYLGYIGPLGGSGANKSVKVDIANDELLCNLPVENIIKNEYSDLREDFFIKSYVLGEIIVEKMRSLMQRTMPRDLYDIWYLFEVKNKDIEDYLYGFRKKAEYKNLNPGDFLKTILSKSENFKRQWNKHLTNQIKEIPNFDDVWRQLGKHWKKFESAN